ncbi:hypothetical protein SCP_0406680 [Sparassis crispa]|uniref:Uncharacterized protein n=1 Tax=Sparassis crispa TaxID=139825 RepID=A0A401GJE5_9APHY|nr:hypothetical protein SCP_0406680 [Sparassis crispa]GBE82284.1 hypothetical protein SCP_0406680 [Sparassis crispa]
MAPIIPPGVPATAHNMFIEHTAELFSIPGLYAWIVQVGHYPVANNNEPAPFSDSSAQNSSIYDVAHWYAAHVTPFEGHFPADLRDGHARPVPPTHELLSLVDEDVVMQPPDPEPPTPGAGNAPAGSTQLSPNPGATPEAGDPDHDMGGH